MSYHQSMKADETIEYYNQNAHCFSSETTNVDLTLIQDRFLLYLNKGDKILDLGCGAGRDGEFR